MKTIVSLTRLS